jgi:hypothetical protein
MGGRCCCMSCRCGRVSRGGGRALDELALRVFASSGQRGGGRNHARGCGDRHQLTNHGGPFLRGTFIIRRRLLESGAISIFISDNDQFPAGSDAGDSAEPPRCPGDRFRRSRPYISNSQPTFGIAYPQNCKSRSAQFLDCQLVMPPSRGGGTRSRYPQLLSDDPAAHFAVAAGQIAASMAVFWLKRAVSFGTGCARVPRRRPAFHRCGRAR